MFIWLKTWSVSIDILSLETQANASLKKWNNPLKNGWTDLEMSAVRRFVVASLYVITCNSWPKDAMKATGADKEKPQPSQQPSRGELLARRI